MYNKLFLTLIDKPTHYYYHQISEQEIRTVHRDINIKMELVMQELHTSSKSGFSTARPLIYISNEKRENIKGN